MKSGVLYIQGISRVFLQVGGLMMDYKIMIFDILNKVENESILKRVYKLLEYLYIKEAGC